MSYAVLPSPIAYGRHLVDTMLDQRAKVDQIRVLVQNTFQLLAAILVSDCAEQGIADDLPSLALEKRFSFGDFISMTCEASVALSPYRDKCYVPELVALYGSSDQETRKRKERAQRFAAIRNEDVHSASLGQTATMLGALLPEVDSLIQELWFLEGYLLVAADALVLSPDMTRVAVQGRVCHGPAREYSVISLEGMQYASCGEVVLYRPGRPTWISLRPWFLFSYNNIGFLEQGIQELLLISAVEKKKLRYCGLTSGNTYRFETDEWLSGTALAKGGATSNMSPTGMREATPVRKGETDRRMNLGTKPTALRYTPDQHKPLEAAQESVLKSLMALPFVSSRRMDDGNIWILLQTAVRAVPIGSLDTDGSFWVNIPSLVRSAEQGLVSMKDLETALEQSPAERRLGAEGMLFTADVMREGGMSWLLALLDKFRHIPGASP